jgi:DNA repair exonuclease SbcCD ATPase subunit
MLIRTSEKPSSPKQAPAAGAFLFLELIMSEMSEQKALALPEQTEVSTPALITINPAEYVAKVFKPFHDKLAVAKHEADGATYDIQTTAGMDAAKKLRMTFRNLRTSAEAVRQDRKAPLIEIGRLLDSSCKALIDEIKPLEDTHDAAIKAEEKRKEEIKTEKARVEAERVAGIQKRVNELRDAPLEAVGKKSDAIQAIIDRVTAVVIDNSFQEFTAAASDAKRDALDKLNQALGAARSHEAEQARLQEEREQMEQQRQEQEAVAAAETERLAEERRQLEAQQAELQRKQQEAVSHAPAQDPEPAPEVSQPVGMHCTTRFAPPAPAASIADLLKTYQDAQAALERAKSALHESTFRDALNVLQIGNAEPIVTITYGKQEKVLLQGIDEVFEPGNYRLRALLIRKDNSVSDVVRTPMLDQVVRA